MGESLRSAVLIERRQVCDRAALVIESPLEIAQGLWRLRERAGPIAGHEEGEARSVRDSVTVMLDWEDAGIVKKPFLEQDTESPKGLLGNGVARCPVAHDGLADDVFQNGSGPSKIVAEFVWIRHLEDHPVIVTVASDFVSP